MYIFEGLTREMSLVLAHFATTFFEYAEMSKLFPGETARSGCVILHFFRRTVRDLGVNQVVGVGRYPVHFASSLIFSSFIT